jgi:HK97 gp10 family phage protein
MSVEITAAFESFELDQGETEALLNGAGSPVAHDLARRAAHVQESAKQHASGRPGPNVRTGNLRDSITWRLDEDNEGLYADVEAEAEYSLFVEEGTLKMRPYPFLRPALEAARGGE